MWMQVASRGEGWAVSGHVLAAHLRAGMRQGSLAPWSKKDPGKKKDQSQGKDCQVLGLLRTAVGAGTSGWVCTREERRGGSSWKGGGAPRCPEPQRHTHISEESALGHLELANSRLPSRGWLMWVHSPLSPGQPVPSQDSRLTAAAEGAATSRAWASGQHWSPMDSESAHVALASLHSQPPRPAWHLPSGRPPPLFIPWAAKMQLVLSWLICR